MDADLGSVMKAAVDFDWERLPFVLEIKGRTMEDYVIQNQDRARNARAKSIECAYNAWTEQLRADQGLFESCKLRSL